MEELVEKMHEVKRVMDGIGYLQGGLLNLAR